MQYASVLVWGNSSLSWAWDSLLYVEADNCHFKISFFSREASHCKPPYSTWKSEGLACCVIDLLSKNLLKWIHVFVFVFRPTLMSASHCHANTMALALRVPLLISTCAAVWMGGRVRTVKVLRSSVVTAPVTMVASASACRTTSSASQ